MIKDHLYSDDTGDAKATVYHLFPDVEVAYISVHMAKCDFGLFEQGERNHYVSAKIVSFAINALSWNQYRGESRHSEYIVLLL